MRTVAKWPSAERMSGRANVYTPEVLIMATWVGCQSEWLVDPIGVI